MMIVVVRRAAHGSARPPWPIPARRPGCSRCWPVDLGVCDVDGSAAQTADVQLPFGMPPDMPVVPALLVGQPQGQPTPRRTRPQPPVDGKPNVNGAQVPS